MEGKKLFSTKGIAIQSGGQAFIKDSGAYGLIALQGHGTIKGIDIQTPIMIRFGDITKDAYFMHYPTAKEKVTVINKGHEPLVIFKSFGPDCNPHMPDIGK